MNQPLIFIPFTTLRSQVLAGLGELKPQLVPLHDPLAYSRYFLRRWKEGKTFINIEHDVEVTEAMIWELWKCQRPWCSCGYNPNDVSPFFGCVKFSEVFIRAHPNLWVERPWGNCDVFLSERSTIPFHMHGMVRHLP